MSTTEDERDAAHRAPAGTPDAVVDAVGAITAAFEVVEHARGMLYAFHRLTGRADAELSEAPDGVVARAGTRSADLTLSSLAEDRLEELGPEVGQLWVP